MVSRRRPRPADAVDRPPIPPPCNDHSTKRRRGAATAATATSASSAWPSMPDDLVEDIADRVLAGGDLLDYVRFRAVCPQWRACTVDPGGRGVADPRFYPRRWTVLPEGHARFVNRDTGAFVRAGVPEELRDHLILDCPDGLLLLQRDADTADVRLLHPFTGDVCELPPLTSLIPQLDRLTYHRPRLDVDDDEHKVELFRRVVAAVSIAPTTGAVTVVLALERIRRFAHASGGDRSWTLTSWITNPSNRVARTLAFHGSLYLTCGRWGPYDSGEPSILRVDPPPAHLEESSLPLPLPRPRRIATLPAKLMTKPQLVECGSEILVVGSTSIGTRLVVVRLADLLLGGPAAPLTSIGDSCLFFDTQSLAVSAKALPSVTANSVVLCTAENRVMQYSLSDDTWSLAACDGDIFQTMFSPKTI